ncbi:hypothetical protein Q5P01_002856 [Channa striata]|uniref:Ig-like domain-containing protein n=1 Tax=Channa striata TaxID=64152 RepID=A0AA88NTW6_CHASR|nr:hypothetical protein Q5P01_002856 [Channa striata]
MGNLRLSWVLSALCWQLCTRAAENTGGCHVTCSTCPITAEVGQDVVLPCQLQPPLNARTQTVEWACNSSNVHIYRNMKDDPDSQNSKFKNRTHLFHHNMTKGNVSLKITNVALSDAGNYICFFPTLGCQCNVTMTVHSHIAGKNSSLCADPKSWIHTGIAVGVGIGIGIAVAVLMSHFSKCGNRSSCP